MLLCVGFGLLRIERRLLLLFDSGLRITLGLPQAVKRAGAGNQLRVLIGQLGGPPCGQPVVKGFPSTLCVGLGHAMLQAGLLQRGLRALGRALRLLDALAQAIAGRAVHEVFQHELLLDFGQVIDHRATQTNQKPGKDHSHQPQATVKPFFGQA